jgi:thymidine kinase
MFRNNLELIVGPVCSGKSAELIRKISRYKIAGYNVLLVKPKIDTRSDLIKSRNGCEMIGYELENAEGIYDLIVNYALEGEGTRDVNIIAFNEAQFYQNLYPVVKDLLQKGFKVVISALDSDFNGNPFGDVTKLLTLSDTVVKLTAVCMKCKNDNAIFSQKLKIGGDQIEIGDLELYHPRCINCFVPGGITGEET